jgi:hypothetical protein
VIAKELLGLDDAEVDRLVAAGALEEPKEGSRGRNPSG